MIPNGAHDPSGGPSGGPPRKPVALVPVAATMPVVQDGRFVPLPWLERGWAMWLVIAVSTGMLLDRLGSWSRSRERPLAERTD